MKETCVENSEYAFLIGKIRALESRLIHPSLFYQLVEAPSFSELCSILSNTSYQDSGESPLLMEYSLEENLLREARELYKLSPSPSPIEPFLWRWEIPFLKKVFRSLVLDSQVEFKGKVFLDHEVYQETCKTKNPFLLPPPFSIWLQKALHTKEEKEDFLAGEISIEKDFLMETIRTPFPLLREYFIQEIDFYNLKLILRRLKNSPLPLESLLPGGTIPSYYLHLLSKGEIDHFIHYLASTSYEILAREGLTHWKEKGEFWKIEFNFWVLRLKILSPANYSPFLPEALYYYLLKKENEIRNLRWIIHSKFAGWEEEKIKERLGPFNV